MSRSRSPARSEAPRRRRFRVPVEWSVPEIQEHAVVPPASRAGRGAAPPRRGVRPARRRCGGRPRGSPRATPRSRRGGTHQARLERDAAEDLTRRRLASLDIGDLPLCFGRLDLAADDGPVLDGADGDAPSTSAASPSPTTTQRRSSSTGAPRSPSPSTGPPPIEPMGVARRRHFHTQPGAVGAGRPRRRGLRRRRGEASGLDGDGRGRALAALDGRAPGAWATSSPPSRPSRTKRSAPTSPACWSSTGGPGTGKTAVALHRAAYLLYTHRKRLASQGVLLVGPSTIFLRYIDQVLPSLGEDEVQLATPAGLKPHLSGAAPRTPPAVARVKGDVRMADGRSPTRCAIASTRSPRDVVVRARRLRAPAAPARLEPHRRARAARGAGTHNERRPYVVRSLSFDHLSESTGVRSAPSAPDDPELGTQRARATAARGASPVVRAAARTRMWPRARAGGELHPRPASRSRAPSAAPAARRRSLGSRRRSSRRARDAAAAVRERLRDVAWTEADLPLVDEADALLGPPSAARPRRGGRAGASADDTAHRSIAELGVGGFITAADVLARYGGDVAGGAPTTTSRARSATCSSTRHRTSSPMQWRMLARRCPSGSMTLVGDFGQASRPGALRAGTTCSPSCPSACRPHR